MLVHAPLQSPCGALSFPPPAKTKKVLFTLNVFSRTDLLASIVLLARLDPRFSSLFHVSRNVSTAVNCRRRAKSTANGMLRPHGIPSTLHITIAPSLVWPLYPLSNLCELCLLLEAVEIMFSELPTRNASPTLCVRDGRKHGMRTSGLRE